MTRDEEFWLYDNNAELDNITLPTSNNSMPNVTTSTPSMDSTTQTTSDNYTVPDIVRVKSDVCKHVFAFRSRAAFYHKAREYGKLYLYFGYCRAIGPAITVTYSYDPMNPGNNHLTASYLPSDFANQVLGTLWIAAAIAGFGNILMRRQGQFVWAHCALVTFALLKCCDAVVKTARFEQLSQTGIPDDPIDNAHAALDIITESMLAAILLTLSAGWGITMRSAPWKTGITALVAMVMFAKWLGSQRSSLRGLYLMLANLVNMLTLIGVIFIAFRLLLANVEGLSTWSPHTVRVDDSSGDEDDSSSRDSVRARQRQLSEAENEDDGGSSNDASDYTDDGEGEDDAASSASDADTDGDDDDDGDDARRRARRAASSTAAATRRQRRREANNASARAHTIGLARTSNARTAGGNGDGQHDGNDGDDDTERSSSLSTADGGGGGGGGGVLPRGTVNAADARYEYADGEPTPFEIAYIESLFQTLRKILITYVTLFFLLYVHSIMFLTSSSWLYDLLQEALLYGCICALLFYWRLRTPRLFVFKRPTRDLFEM